MSVRPLALAALSLGLATTPVLVPALLSPSAVAVGSKRASIGNPVEGNLGYNAFVEQNTTLGSTEAEGPIATGGNLTFGSGYNVSLHTPGTFTAPGDDHPAALVVGGRVDFAGSSPGGVLKVLSGGYTKIGDLTGAHAVDRDVNGAQVNTQVVASGAVHNSVPRIEMTLDQPLASVGPAPGLIDFTSAFEVFRERARMMAACAQNVTLLDDAGNPLPDGPYPPGVIGHLTLTPGRTNVLHLTGQQMNALSEINFHDQPTKDTPLLIVTDTTAEGGVFVWDNPNTAGISGPQAPYVLWDFPDATDLTMASGDSLEGTVYAPNAHLKDVNASNLEGDVIARAYDAGPLAGGTSIVAGELHYWPFDAVIDCESTSPSPSPSGTGKPAPSPSPSPSPSPGPSTSPSPNTGPSPSPSASRTRPAPSPTGPGGELPATGAGPGLPLAAATAAAALATGTLLLRRRGRRH
ncbi:choice-of-anchor A family protein [Kitasatospora phosalacinea]|uniref:choice-of-anchor A family protein n=1 Tax=Kitasatospora phosalacinea TaxID=2065 RepID=UPI00068A3E4E|nr:choice-of-anchor A family protein [Kitasatospora phosalacinea]